MADLSKEGSAVIQLFLVVLNLLLYAWCSCSSTKRRLIRGWLDNLWESAKRGLQSIKKRLRPAAKDTKDEEEGAEHKEEGEEEAGEKEEDDYSPAEFFEKLVLNKWLNEDGDCEIKQDAIVSALEDCKSLTITVMGAVLLFCSFVQNAIPKGSGANFYGLWLVSKPYIGVAFMAAIVVMLIYTLRLLVVTSVLVSSFPPRPLKSDATKFDAWITHRQNYVKFAKETMVAATRFYAFSTRALQLILPFTALLFDLWPLLVTTVLHFVLAWVFETSFDQKEVERRPTVKPMKNFREYTWSEIRDLVKINWSEITSFLKRRFKAFLPSLIVLIGFLITIAVEVPDQKVSGLSSYLQLPDPIRKEMTEEQPWRFQTWSAWVTYLDPICGGILFFLVCILQFGGMDSVLSLEAQTAINLGELMGHMRNAAYRWGSWLTYGMSKEWADLQSRESQGTASKVIHMFVDCNSKLALMCLAGAGAMVKQATQLKRCKYEKTDLLNGIDHLFKEAFEGKPATDATIETVVNHACHARKIVSEAKLIVFVVLLVVLSLYLYESCRLALFISFLQDTMVVPPEAKAKTPAAAAAGGGSGEESKAAQEEGEEGGKELVVMADNEEEEEEKEKKKDVDEEDRLSMMRKVFGLAASYYREVVGQLYLVPLWGAYMMGGGFFLLVTVAGLCLLEQLVPSSVPKQFQKFNDWQIKKQNAVAKEVDSIVEAPGRTSAVEQGPQ